MKILIPVMGAAALSLLAGCAGYYGGYAAGPGYDYAAVPAYYDDFYGPYYGGYWGPDAVFVFKDKRGREHRDDGRHFRNAPRAGFHAVTPRPRRPR
jgi:hypothetical protein